MGTTMDDIKYDMYIQEEWEDEKKKVFEALEKIANSRNTSELIKNLKELKSVYISNKPVGNKNLDKAIGDINLEMPKLKEYIRKEFKKQDKKQEKSNKKYFVYGSVVTIIFGVIFSFFAGL